MKIALIFPGQGSQSVGMGRDLYDNFKTAKDVFEEASDAIHVDMKKLCFEGPKEYLGNTHNTQPALLTASTAAFRVLTEESGISADFMAGHSLGEYSALTASGAISFTQAIKLVRFRGRVMNEAAAGGLGEMAAILGLKREDILAAIDEAKEGDVLTAANFNSPGQIIISGHADAIDRAIVLCKEKGAKRAMKLAVSGPFHSELMSKAADRLEEELSTISFNDPKVAVYSNVSAIPYVEAHDIAPLLVKQIKSSVMWEDSVNNMITEGAGMFIEVGPGKVLTGLVKRIKKDAELLNVFDTASLKNSIETTKSYS